ncbi:MAG: Cell division coordinator CpoB [Candidatus Scalindua arabica]|uniref:Cell division coordinator CpoB n=1 Tax=Candidatus Scalindua arabica TaxID=1127984 RepID=A0A941W5C7_9BACT|nr:Cell division coordinator CpoB [Candidatus Scalindua arabica]
MNTENPKLRRTFMNILTIFLLLVGTTGYVDADVQNDAGAKLLNVPVNKFKKMVDNERTVLAGLKKLLELKQRHALQEEDMAVELITDDEGVSINRSKGNYGTTMYSIKADLISVEVILQRLASVSMKKIIIDEDIDKDEIASVISVDLEDNPLIDIIDVILGAKGLEPIISENLIFVTLPAKLNVVSSYGYYQDKAVQAYQKAMIKYPDYEGIAQAYYELGNFYLDSNFPSIALQEYRTVSANYSDHPLAKKSKFSEGKCYVKLDDLEKARGSYLNYVRRYPNESNVDDTYLIIGDLWKKQGNHEKAIENYNYVIKEYHDSDTVISAHMRLGKTYLDAGDYSVALQTFLDIKEKFQSESDMQAYQSEDTILTSDRLILPEKIRYELEYQIGNCYHLSGNYEEAIHTLSKFVLYETGNGVLDKAYYKLADCFFKSGDFLTAFQLYKGALAEYPDSSLSPIGFLYSGKSLRIMKMLDSAVEILNQGLDKYPDSIYAESIKFEIGLCYLDDENNKRAFDVFKRIAEREKEKNLAVEADIYAGICLGRDRQFEKAIENYRKVLDGEVTEEQRTWVSGLIGDSYSELGLLTEAVKAYKQDI